MVVIIPSDLSIISFVLFKENYSRTSEMLSGYSLFVPALSSIPRTHVEIENQLPQVFF